MISLNILFPTPCLLLKQLNFEEKINPTITLHVCSILWGRRGWSALWGFLSTMGAILSTVEVILSTVGGILSTGGVLQYAVGILTTMGHVQYHEGISSVPREMFSTSHFFMFSTMGRFHDTCVGAPQY